MAVLFGRAGFASNTPIVLGRLTGLYGALLTALQLLPVARLPWFDRRRVSHGHHGSATPDV